MNEHGNPSVSTRRERLKRRLSRLRRRRTDEVSVRRDETRRKVRARLENPLTWDPVVPGTKTWKQVGGFTGPGREQIELAASRAEPGGVPVVVDPAMVTPATAEKMRPLVR